jgi:hypothetical protein
MLAFFIGAASEAFFQSGSGSLRTSWFLLSLLVVQPCGTSVKSARAGEKVAVPPHVMRGAVEKVMGTPLFGSFSRRSFLGEG